MHHFLATLNKKANYINSIWLFDARGDVRATTRAFPIRGRINVSDRDYFRSAELDGHETFSGSGKSPPLVMATGLGGIRPSTGSLEERLMNVARLHTFLRREADPTLAGAESTSLHPVVGIEQGHSHPPRLVSEVLPTQGNETFSRTDQQATSC